MMVTWKSVNLSGVMTLLRKGVNLEWTYPLAMAWRGI
jgi:hypothetical protein